ncbi:hypothetical protein MKZ38_001033 [Zalerion maritima]|uniref:Uncharacterized protein n=1 Tax=Zalerion maritima TaxID=339359 RepID=A0AAD5RRZ5_9PEZI|nr:hypothetical protein MKZ38_001033 [Zalerion maritima]
MSEHLKPAVAKAREGNPLPLQPTYLEAKTFYTKLRLKFFRTLRHPVDNYDLLYSSTVENVADPKISVHGAETIEWPPSLSDIFQLRNASLISRCTNIDVWGLDTHHIPARFVTFGNPDWDAFVQLTARRATNSMGNQNEVVAQLYSLSFVGRTIQLPSPRPKNKPQSKFGTLFVILPTEHEGGGMLLRRGGKSEELATSLLSEHACLCIAFAPDVDISIESVISGNLIYLAYDLVPGNEGWFLKWGTEPKETMASLVDAWDRKSPKPNLTDCLPFFLDPGEDVNNLAFDKLQAKNAQTISLLREACATLEMPSTAILLASFTCNAEVLVLDRVVSERGLFSQGMTLHLRLVIQTSHDHDPTCLRFQDRGTLALVVPPSRVAQFAHHENYIGEHYGPNILLSTHLAFGEGPKSPLNPTASFSYTHHILSRLQNGVLFNPSQGRQLTMPRIFQLFDVANRVAKESLVLYLVSIPVRELISSYDLAACILMVLPRLSESCFPNRLVDAILKIENPAVRLELATSIMAGLIARKSVQDGAELQLEDKKQAVRLCLLLTRVDLHVMDQEPARQWFQKTCFELGPRLAQEICIPLLQRYLDESSGVADRVLMWTNMLVVRLEFEMFYRELGLLILSKLSVSEFEWYEVKFGFGVGAGLEALIRDFSFLVKWLLNQPDFIQDTLKCLERLTLAQWNKWWSFRQVAMTAWGILTSPDGWGLYPEQEYQGQVDVLLRCMVLKFIEVLVKREWKWLERLKPLAVADLRNLNRAQEGRNLLSELFGDAYPFVMAADGRGLERLINKGFLTRHGPVGTAKEWVGALVES